MAEAYEPETTALRDPDPGGEVTERRARLRLLVAFGVDAPGAEEVQERLRCGAGVAGLGLHGKLDEVGVVGKDPFLHRHLVAETLRLDPPLAHVDRAEDRQLVPRDL